MSEVEPDPTQDPDLTHLRNLLTLLPPLKDRDWWAFFDRRHPNHPEKIGNTVKALKTRDPLDIATACRYLLLYFGDSDKSMWLHLGTARVEVGHSEHVIPGRWLAEDLAKTAWTLYVRYHDRRRGMQSWGLTDPH